MEVKYLDLAGAAFDFAAPPVNFKRCNTGLISDTFFIDCGEGKPGYILQKINTEIFREPEKLMSNIKGVCSHIAKKVEEEGGDPLREVRTVISTKTGEDYYIDPEGGFWRAFLEISDVISYDYPDSPELFYKSAVAFGRFARQLADYPAETMYETIPNFHNSKSRMEQFKDAVSEDKMGRVGEMAEEISFALSKEPLCTFITDGLNDGRFRLCVTHNDTKINNVLMDKHTGEGVCIIDLDIVMPGSVLYDFGDAIRFGASTALEDETDLSKVALDLEMFDVFVNGFVGELRDSMNDDEILALPMGAYLMTLETGIRFLGDYLNGDVYYHINYPEHNRDRARNQLALLRDMDSKMEEMQAIVEKYL
ncbi:MAG: aminoglycoside phosphotransferase family protein [Clostridia bacterium]|nr:aminoglycoside phosphotransferase family protein [Clostridia bacterium]